MYYFRMIVCLKRVCDFENMRHGKVNVKTS